MASTRDNRVGAGYDYQWDVSTFLLLTYVLTPRRPSLPLEQDFGWLGSLVSVHLEGDPDRDALEDLTFHGLSGRRIHLQVKVRENDRTRWKKKDDDLIEFLNRAAHKAETETRRFVFLTNAGLDKHLQELLDSAEELGRYRDEVAWRHFAGKNPKTVDAQVAPVASYKLLTELVVWRKFLPPTELGTDNLPMSGVAEASLSRLYELGVHDSMDAYFRVYNWVKNCSFNKHGTLLTIEEVRSKILELLGLREADVVRRRNVISLLEKLNDPRRDQHLQISLEHLRLGRLFVDQAELDQAQALLEREGILLVLGPRASGKTFFISQLGFRASRARGYPMIWDFENDGRELPTDASRYLSDVTASAKVLGLYPLLILENVHLNPTAFQTILALAPGFAGLNLLATARDREFLVREMAESQQVRLAAVTFPLGNKPRLRGERLLSWYLKDVRGLELEEQRRVYRSVDWVDFMDDLVVLRTALESYDWNGYSLSIVAFNSYLLSRIKSVVRGGSGSYDLLYVVSALGRFGVPVDLEAMARMLGRSEDEIRDIALRFAGQGLLEFTADGHLIKFWHQSMAELFWQMFRMNRALLGRGVRSCFEGMRG
ncbi:MULTISPECIES: hypothetical protein [unclassified Corallococcus]|uniref:hypothetical protein n=1 Tax=unclassified Corallococcus TaxID=2685029 RepID=UPI001F5E07E9|nr:MULTISPECIES: hypothetical protein [unclassified Corallococcus]WAS84363.1 hypothetical protein O0N60_34415 [Corallococcus sp. NCRR]